MLEVIGAGLGRTGTLSLKAALEQLGFTGCYHMVDVFAHPEHVPLWQAAADRKRVDWDALFAGYRSAVDWPAAHFWRGLADHYPNAKVILTERDPEKWYKSFSETILRLLTMPPAPNPEMQAHGKMVRDIITEQTFGGKLDDKAHILDVYRRHNEDVRRTIPVDRLLVFDAPQGWEPLCRFLGVPVPKTEFPRTNSTDEFIARIAPRAAK